MACETNIDYWKKILENPTSAFQEMFDVEREFLITYILENEKVLEIGCGTGRNTETITTKTTNVIGVDSDLFTVNEFNNKFRHSSNVCAVLGGAHNLCFEDNRFDVAVLFCLMPNLSDTKIQSFAEIARVLKKGGRLLLSTYAETSLSSRLEMYKAVKAPIHSIDDDGKIVFQGLYEDIISEQFSLAQLENFGKGAGLKMIFSQKVGELAYLVVFQK